MKEIVKTLAIEDENATIEFASIAFLPKHGSTVMKHLHRLISMQDMGYGHLKRIRKNQSTGELQALVYPVGQEMYIKFSELEQLVQTVQASSQTIHVPKWPSQTKQSYERNNQLWPMIFHPNTKATIEPLSLEEIQQMKQMMMEAIQDTKEASSIRSYPIAGCLSHGAVFVNPITNQVLARASDMTEDDSTDLSSHPLTHAALRIIHVLAKQHNQVHKKRKHDIATTPWPKISSQDMYLATTLDAYFVREPCCFCAMALVHSRVRRVIYGCPNPIGGALGSNETLHFLPSLNHHYRVFRDVALDECQNLMNSL